MNRVLCVLFAALTLVYAGKGFYVLTMRPEPPSDFHQRWVEQQYVLAGRNPYDVFFASPNAAIHPQPWAHRDSRPLPEIGAPKIAGYPPWAYFSGALFFWPPNLTIARWYYAAWNAAGLGILFLLGYRIGRPCGTWEGAALGFAGTAQSAVSTTLGVGQYSILILALLILSLWSLQRERPRASGSWHALAAAKPISSGPFGLIFLFPPRWRGLVVMAGYLAVASDTVWLLTHTNPAEMLSQMLASGQTFIGDSYGLLNALTWLGLPLLQAEVAVALGCVGAACLLLALYPRAPMLTQFAIASVAARLWSYHHLYDNLLLVFLLMAMAELTLRKPTPLHGLALFFTGATLWLPGSYCDWLPFQMAQIAIWMAALALLLRRTPFRHAAPDLMNLSPTAQAEPSLCKS